MIPHPSRRLPAPSRRLGLWKAFWLVFVLGGHGFAVGLLWLLCCAQELGLEPRLRPVFSSLLLAPLVLMLAALPVLLAPDRGEHRGLQLLARAWAGVVAAACFYLLPLATLLLFSRLAAPESPS